MPLQDAKLNYGPIHTNNNMICAVDIRVGGLDPTLSDLLEICVMPMNHSYRPHAEFAPFNLSIKPSFLVDLKVAKISKPVLEEQFLYSAIDAIKAAELFEHWWTQIRVRPNKQIICLTWDWPTKKPWLKYWLDTAFEELFTESYRDLLPMLNFINDREDFFGNDIPYKVPSFSQLVFRSGLTLLSRNSLLANCKAMSDCYRYLLHQR